MTQLTLLDDPNFREFYVIAKKNTYAAGGDQKAEVLRNCGKRYVFYDGERWPQWRYTDIYHGYNPFFGNELVEEIGNTMPSVWMPIAQMAYGGFAKGDADLVKIIFGFLEEMLQRVSIKSPFRGPQGWSKDKKYQTLQYYCNWKQENPFCVYGEEQIITYARYEGDPNTTLYHLNFIFSCSTNSPL